MSSQRPNRLAGAVAGPLERLAAIGVTAADDDALRAQKSTLTLATCVVTVLSVIWVATYLALGLPGPASIPLLYQVVSIASLVLFARGGSFRWFRVSQLGLMLVLPFVLQWSLGGYRASSAVSLWALIPALAALFFYSARTAIPWFVGFLALTVLSGLIDPIAASRAVTIPAPVHTAFFVLNVGGVSLTAYLLIQYFVRAREAALQRSERLLLNVLPRPIAERLKHTTGVIAESHREVTVLFADIVGFTPFVERTPAEQVVGVLDEVFSAFDRLADQHGLEKIKTIGDAYMVVAGLPESRPDHAQAAADMALEMQTEIGRLSAPLGTELAIRVGMDMGPVIAGVIGRRKFIYDVWGDTVNTASRMESQGLPARIQVTRSVHDRLAPGYRFERRGEIQVKGKGRIEAYLLIGRREPG